METASDGLPSADGSPNGANGGSPCDSGRAGGSANRFSFGGRGVAHTGLNGYNKHQHE